MRIKHMVSAISIAALSLALPASAFAAVTTVQQAPFQYLSQSNCNSPSTFSVAYPSNVTAGNLLVVTVAYKGTAGSAYTPTDSQGNTYTLLSGSSASAGPGSNSNRRIGVYSTIAGSTGANTVTVECADTEGHAQEVPLVYLHEYSGQNGSTPITNGIARAGSSSTGTNIPADSGTATINAGNLWVMDFMAVNWLYEPNYLTGFTSGTYVNGSVTNRGSMGTESRVMAGGDSGTAYGQVTWAGVPGQWAASSFQVNP